MLKYNSMCSIINSDEVNSFVTVIFDYKTYFENDVSLLDNFYKHTQLYRELKRIVMKYVCINGEVLSNT